MPSPQISTVALYVISLVLTQGGHAMVSEFPEAPSDFELRYEWKEASLPPPHHYEYTICVGPGTRGEIHFLPDYPLNDTPQWIESFDLSPDEMAGLWQLVNVARAKVQDLPEPIEEVVVGGVVESLEITAGGETFTLPSDRKSEATAKIVERVRSLLPEALWELMMSRRRDYWKGETAESPPTATPRH